MICENCGEKLAPWARNCPNCGQPVLKEVKVTKQFLEEYDKSIAKDIGLEVENAKAAVAEPEKEEPNKQKQEKTVKKHKNKKKIISAIIVPLVLIVIISKIISAINEAKIQAQISADIKEIEKQNEISKANYIEGKTKATRIKEVDCILYNDMGEVSEDFYKQGTFFESFSSVDESAIVLGNISESSYYLVWPDFSYEVLGEAGSVLDAWLSHDGKRVLYLTDDEIWLYDCVGKEEKKVASEIDLVDTIEMSPDGNYVAWMDYNVDRMENEVFRYSYIDDKTDCFECEADSIIAVSNSGDIFVEDDNNKCIFVISDDDIKNIFTYSVETLFRFHFNMDCSEMLTLDFDHNLYYYKMGMSQVEQIDMDNAELSSIEIAASYTDSISGSRVYNVESLEGAMIETNDEDYHSKLSWLMPDHSLKTITEMPYSSDIKSVEGKPAVLCHSYKSAIIQVYDNGEIIEEVVQGDVGTYGHLAANEDFSAIWYIDSANNLCLNSNGNSQVMVEGVDDTTNTPIWNKEDNKCYFVKNNKIYSIDESGNTALRGLDASYIDDNYPGIYDFGYCHFSESEDDEFKSYQYVFTAFVEE